MKPPVRPQTEFEKVTVGEMINGTLHIEYDQEHKFKGFEGKPDTIQPAVRFIFDLEGYQFKHYSRWYKFSYSEKSNLYKKIVSKLVEGAKPDMDFDLDCLEGMQVKTIWDENGGFQNLDSIFPLNGKIKADAVPPTKEEPIAEEA